MPLLETRGAASVQGFGALAASARNYIEDVFSTYLYTGNGSTQTITNGIDLSGKGGLVWIKDRTAARSNVLFDTLRGATYRLISNTTAAQNNEITALGGFNSTGFSTGYKPEVNESGETYASWTFRKQAKFFDVVTYTGDGVAGRTIAHNLGSVPGCIIVKRTDTTGDWQVYHRANTANPETDYLVLNTTAATADSDTRWNDTLPTSTVFSLGTDATVNANTGTYVAYLFAHDAGGFGASGSDNVISCGSYTGSNSVPASVNLGWEPQWVLIKGASGTAANNNWVMYDVMRGMPTGSAAERIWPNLSGAASVATQICPTATGFRIDSVGTAEINFDATTYIYIAIRRGPMKTPTTGTSVYTGVTRSGTGTSATISAGFVVDWWHCFNRGAGSPQSVSDRLRGSIKRFETNSTAAEDSTGTDVIFSSSQLGIVTSTLTGVNYNASGNTYIDHLFARAPGFFDVVCNEGDGTTNRAISHNLGVVPELLIGKNRNASGADFNWQVGSPLFSSNQVMQLNLTSALNAVGAPFGTTAATSTQFRVGADAGNSYIMNRAAQQYVYYLFATCPGVSKVGTYTSTGNTLQIDCGFTGGARFVLIKRTDSTGDWYVWDSARGIVAGNDPYLLLNSTAAEVTTTDWVDTHSPGFELSNAGGNNANINTATYIFLAIA